MRTIIDRAQARGEIRDGVSTLYSDAPIDDDYWAAVADLAWHVLARRTG
ncbi:hypothetical protein [Mycobacterium tilburgii]|nr:hypothetical protein [Mycobacterium tilburgii]